MARALVKIKSGRAQWARALAINNGRDKVGRALVEIKRGRDDVARALVKIRSGRDDEARSGPTAGKD